MPINTQPDSKYMADFLIKLLKTASPTGNTDAAISLIDAACRQLGLKTYRTVKGALVANLPGASPEKGPAKTVTGHVDTLGAMVKEIKANGRLKLSALGGYLPATVAGEYCIVETASGETISGTVLLNKQSVHVHSRDEVAKLGASINHLEVRLDARTQSRDETVALGIAVGDFVAWDPRTKYTDAGFVKSRHLDDKAGVAAMIGAVELMKRAGVPPLQPAYLYFSTYEEVGHGGAAGIPENTEEMLVVDMGAVGEGQASDEFGVSICVKDRSGPYDLHLRRRLVQLAEAANIPYNLDVYVNYNSDGSAALYAGVNVRVGLIGPGVDSSHAYERTHIESVANSARLIAEYLTV